MAMTNSRILAIAFVGMLVSTVCVAVGYNPPIQDTASADNDAAATQQVSASPLIGAEKLKELIDSGQSNLRILEPSKSLKAYQKGHIPSAFYLHWVDDMINPKDVERYTNLDAEQFAKLVNKLGINKDTQIVIYDRMSSRLSTRLFWTFKYFGHDQVRILDGGFKAWGSQYRLSTETPDSPVAAESEFAVQMRTELLAEIKFVRDHLDDSNVRFIDGRPTDQYTGKDFGKVFHTGKPHRNKGHIPEAVNVFWKDNFQPNGTFKSIPELRKLYADAGVKPDQCVVTYCNEGLHAAPPWFVLTELLGYKDVRLYDSSMAEWANADNPIDKK